MERELIIDGAGHVAGCLASFIAKKLLTGYKVTVLSTERICFIGALSERMEKYRAYKRKRCAYNPARGPFTLREPSQFFKKMVRGMTPRKTKRGTRALERLTCYEGIPKAFENVERVIFPQALLKVEADPEQKTCTMGELLGRFGWSHGALAEKLTNEVYAREAAVRAARAEAAERRAEAAADPAFTAELQKRIAEFA